MTQHFDKWDLWGIGTLAMLLVLITLHYVTKVVLETHWRRMTRRWPREQHRSYFSDCRRVPEE